MLFVAFFTVQNLLTSVLNGTLASRSLAVLYFALAAGNLVSANVVMRIPQRTCMVLGASTYTIWHVCAALAAFGYVTWMLYLGSLLLGLGAAVIWVSQSMYLGSLTTPDRIGHWQGIFFLIFGVNPIIGQVSVSWVT